MLTGKCFKIIFLLIMVAGDLGTNVTARYPFYDVRDDSLSTTFTDQPLGLVCIGISGCQENNSGRDESCFRHSASGAFVLVSCVTMTWSEAAAYCQENRGALITKEVLMNHRDIREVAKRKSTCRKFWLYKPDTFTSTQVREFKLTTVKVTVSLSTDDPLSITSPTAVLTTNSSGKSVLIISFTLPVGILVLGILLVICYFLWRRKRLKTKFEDANSFKKTEANLADPQEEQLLQDGKENVADPQEKLQPLQDGEENKQTTVDMELTTCTQNDENNCINLRHKNLKSKIKEINEICDPVTIEELGKTAINRDYADIVKRMESFSNWDYGHNQSPKTLAEAGFYSKGERDKVWCFMCNLAMEKWDISDEPWLCHHEYSNKCPYLEGCKQSLNGHLFFPETEDPVEAGTNTEKTDDMNKELCIECKTRKTGCLFHECEHACCCWECGKKAQICRKCGRPITSKVPFDFRTIKIP